MKKIILTETQFNEIIKEIINEQSDEDVSTKDLVELEKLKSYINGLKINSERLNNAINKYYDTQDNKQAQVDVLRRIVNILDNIENESNTTMKLYGRMFIHQYNSIEDSKDDF